MANRPVIGQTTWGGTLNDHLETSINVDGTLKDAAINAAATTITGDIARMKTRVFDVRDYASIQAALTAAGVVFGATPYGGGTVYLPRGEFEITSQLVVPKGVMLVGSGSYGTRIKAGATFPINTTMIRLGSVANASSGGPYDHSMMIRDMEIDCNNIAGSIGVESQTAQEASGLDGVRIVRYRKHAVLVHSPNGFEAANSYLIQDCEFFHAQLGSAAAIKVKNLGISLEVRRTTITGYEQAAGATNALAIDAEDCNVLLNNVHLEFNTVGVWSKNGPVGIGGLKAEYLDGHPSVNTLVKVSDQAKTQLAFVRDKGAAVTVDWSFAGKTLTGFVTRFDNTVNTYSPQRTDVQTVTSGYHYCQPWNRTILMNATSAAAFVDLPELLYSIGAEYIIKKIDASANTVTISRASTDTIESATSVTLTTRWQTLHIIGTSAGWVRV